MTRQTASLIKKTAHRNLRNLQQAIKWTVYTLLIVNFGFYVYEDVDRAIHTLTLDSTFFDWTSEFSTTFDSIAWFVLLFMFELETWWLEDRHWKPWTAKLVHGARILCYITIAHTLVAYIDGFIDYQPTRLVENATSLCDLTDDDLSYVFNLEYTAIDSENCAQLSDDSAFYFLGENPLVTTHAGLELERNLALADVIEAATWLVIVFSIEYVIRLQTRGFTTGTRRSVAQWSKLIGYGILFVLIAFWARHGHWLYVWDELLWIGGFAIIDINLGDWREELRAETADQLSVQNRNL